MIEKTRILFVAANPKNTNKLRLDEEIREIQARIRAADFRDAFDLISRWAVRPGDLLQAFNEVRPHIVHFSGHGSPSSQLVLEDSDGNAKPVTDDAIVALFKHLKENIRLVLLNACHSDAQAQAISTEIECTIGMNQDIGDEAAIIFASQFYGALAFGQSVGQAFDQGRTAIMLNGIPESTTPILLVRPGINALSVSFIIRAPLSPVLPPIALDILKKAVNGNTPVNFIRHTGGIGITAGSSQFDSNHDLEKAALLEHAIGVLVQLGWLRQQDDGLFFVTHSGYDAAHKFQGGPPTNFLNIRDDMPALIAEMKKGLEGETNKCIREFFVISRKQVLGGAPKPRFIYYEEDHDNLRGKMDILENLGYLIDVTSGNCPIYRMTEEFVKLVLTYG